MKEVDLPLAWKKPVTVIGVGILLLTLLLAGTGRLSGATEPPAQPASGTPAAAGSLDSGPTPIADGGFRASVLNPIQTMIAQFRPTPAADASRLTVWMAIIFSGGSADISQPTPSQTPGLSSPVILGATAAPGVFPTNVLPATVPPPPAFTPGPPAQFPGGDDEGHGRDHYEGDEDD